MALGNRLRDLEHKVLETVSNRSAQDVANYARMRRDQLIQSNRASATFTTFVDGVQNGVEEQVKLRDGFISYLFARLSEAVVFALATARDKSPVDSGAYRDSWFVAVNGVPWTGSIEDIPRGTPIMVLNKQRYHRKIDTGGQRTSVPPGITEAVRQAVMRKYPALQVDRAFVTIPGDPPLKGHAIASGLSYVRTRGRNKGGWSRKHAPKRSRAKDRRAGQPLTYPAVIISERVR